MDDFTTSGQDPQLITEIIHRASSPTYEKWWGQVTHAGYCAAPVHLRGRDAQGKTVTILARCKNRRATICPSCSALYAGDTWQLVHRGITPDPAATDAKADELARVMVFATLTAPSFGPVHTARRSERRGEQNGPCRPARGARSCRHGRPAACSEIHSAGDPRLGEPLCHDCYDYPSHVLFTWHSPELWHRFTIALRRLIRRQLRDLGHDPKSVRVSYIKVVELQRRGVPHYHAVVRLDSVQDGEDAPGPVPLTTTDLMLIVRQAVDSVCLEVPSLGGELVTLRFGEQTDVQPLRTTRPSREPDSIEARAGDHDRRIASYLAKYVTKSVNEFGLTPRRFSPLAVETIDVRPHVRAILRTILDLAESPGPAEMVRWLHTLGYRGHITTKTLRYSTTMGALRAHRAEWRSLRMSTEDSPENQTEAPARADAVWEFIGAGHATDGDRLLALTAAALLRESRQAGREELACGVQDGTEA